MPDDVINDGVKAVNADPQLRFIANKMFDTIEGLWEETKSVTKQLTGIEPEKIKGKYWPIVSGASMNAVDHPFGNKRSSRKGRSTIAPKNAPPGRKVGMIKPRQTGRNK